MPVVIDHRPGKQITPPPLRQRRDPAPSRLKYRLDRMWLTPLYRRVFRIGLPAFVLAMVGMVLVPDTILRSLAAGAILVGVVSVLAALTLLPAILGLLGDRVNALRIPWLGRRIERSAGTEGRTWSRVVRFVMRTPLVSAAVRRSTAS